MKKILAVLFVTIFSLGILACGDDESFNNVAACEKWVKTISCGTFNPSTSIPCSSYSNVTACDISDYFTCLTTNFKCKDVAGTKVPDMTGWTACAAKAKCN